MDRVQIAMALITSKFCEKHSDSLEKYSNGEWIRAAFDEADLILKIAAETEPKQPEQQRTVAQVMREALSEEVYQKWLANNPVNSLDEVTNLKASEILFGSFGWESESNEGHYFWGEIHNKLEAEGK